jgi:hypothetical protein
LRSDQLHEYQAIPNDLKANARVTGFLRHPNVLVRVSKP